MRLCRFHPVDRDDPQPFLKIDLIPPCPQGLFGPCGCENQEFQRQFRFWLCRAGAQFTDKFGDVIEVERFMVLHIVLLSGQARQRCLHWIVARKELAGTRPSDYRRDPLAKAFCRLRLLCPDG
jgi:hypothetical protein